MSVAPLLPHQVLVVKKRESYTYKWGDVIGDVRERMRTRFTFTAYSMGQRIPGGFFATRNVAFVPATWDPQRRKR